MVLRFHAGQNGVRGIRSDVREPCLGCPDPNCGDTVGEQIDHKLTPSGGGLGNEAEVASEILDTCRGRGIQQASQPDRVRRVVGNLEEGLRLVAEGPKGDSVVFLVSTCNRRLSLPGGEGAENRGEFPQSLLMSGNGRDRQDHPLASSAAKAWPSGSST